jgi:hypothetical protein
MNSSGKSECGKPYANPQAVGIRTSIQILVSYFYCNETEPSERRNVFESGLRVDSLCAYIAAKQKNLTPENKTSSEDLRRKERVGEPRALTNQR